MRVLKERITPDKGQSFKVHFHTGPDICDFNYWHFHPEYEIVYIHNGSGTRNVGNHSSHYDDGELIFLGPNIPHLPFGNQERPDNMEVVIQFTEGFLQRQILSFPEFKNLERLVGLSRSGVAYGAVTRNKLARYIGDVVHSSEAEKLLTFLRILLDLQEASDFRLLDSEPLKLRRPHADGERLNAIYDHISENYRDPFKLETLASKIGLTKNSLCRFFKQTTGKTLTQFVLEYRITLAKEELRNSRHNINEIMYRTGFTDPSFFNAKFREISGITPSQYRKEMQPNESLAY
ncbi:MAG: helix-turn-helix domain-containing protein [Cyclobacteriaceae bacterium]|nr:helix-turn-helix domain-containing protein [Cyclobacteriaceae bacterium HetDA_MAG_MS6]